jgi:hypothetical protein
MIRDDWKTDSQMAKLGKGVSIVQRENGGWRVQIRRKGFPYQTRVFLSHIEADEWAIAQLATMQETGRLVDLRPTRETTLGDVIDLYLAEVTAILREHIEEWSCRKSSSTSGIRATYRSV